MNLKRLSLPHRYNYIACFLTLDCNLNCGYCVNRFGNGGHFKRLALSGKEWLRALGRIVSREDLPVTLQGGEPSLHPDFIQIIKNMKRDLNIDILTNLSFDEDEFIKEVDPARLRRNVPYPNIRASYHPFATDLEGFIRKILKLQDAGFSIGAYGILHPRFTEKVWEAAGECRKVGIDFRTKEFLGEFESRIYGTYRYSGAVAGKETKSCLCRNSELIIAPDASIYRCHHDLYKDFPPIGNLMDPGFEIEDIFRGCERFGDCNPCDLKVKTNRLQRYGHTSVEIKDIK